MSSWMILPFLFLYLFVGLVLTACKFPEDECGSRYDDARFFCCVIWPLVVFYTVMVNGSRIVSILITKYLTK